MILFPPAKINLGLKVLNKREDGFHNLETVFFQIPFCDILEIVKSEKFTFKSSGLTIFGEEKNNLCIKAYELLKNDFDLEPVLVHLHKIIPMGAGLGGGSADGTYTLLILNELFNLNLSSEQLKEYALILGSDCPLFVESFPQYATGRGEVLEKINVDLKGKYIYLINNGTHIQTKQAFENLKLNPNSEANLKQLVENDVLSWKEELENNFETSVFPQNPELKSIKEKMYQNGAIYASMTGTGSTIYGIFEKKPESIFTNKQKNIFEKIVCME
ncbi:MAG: 4-(cytidine 5'-diphospho)-2-C-methyl-D-erythritol kinase [Bacteroidota bacterium]